MKKLMIALAFAGFAFGAQAQETTPTEKYSVATNSFWSNWFVQVGGDFSAWYSGQEHGLGLDHSPFKKFRSNPGAAVAIGKWFTPGLGLRTKVQGIWGKQVNSAANTSNKYWLAQEQAMFNLSNLLCGYNPNRVWNVIPFAGGGFGRSMDANLYGMSLSAGIQSSWKLSKVVNLYLEAGYNRMEGDVDGNEAVRTPGRGWNSHDNQLYAELGLNFNLGKTGWNKTPDVDAIKAQYQNEIDGLRNQLNDANAENDRLKNLLANQPKVENKTIREFVTAPVSVFFNINKTNIASQKDLVNVRALAKYAADNDSKLMVNGYADSATGTPARNEWLSNKRAEVVAGELVKMGVKEGNITTKGNGGVDELSPISFNRRATVQIVE